MYVCVCVRARWLLLDRAGCFILLAAVPAAFLAAFFVVWRGGAASGRGGGGHNANHHPSPLSSSPAHPHRVLLRVLARRRVVRLPVPVVKRRQLRPERMLRIWFGHQHEQRQQDAADA